MKDLLTLLLGLFFGNALATQTCTLLSYHLDDRRYKAAAQIMNALEVLCAELRRLRKSRQTTYSGDVTNSESDRLGSMQVAQSTRRGCAP